MASTMRETPRKKSATPKSATTATRTRKTTTARPLLATHDQIALRAHELYERSGRQPGREVEFWLEAERQLREELGA
jgi:hypothetical protein